MDKNTLLDALRKAPILDLYTLYQEVGDSISLYTLMDALNEIKKEHGLDTRLSSFKTQIERLLEDSNFSGGDSESIQRLKDKLEFEQRGHSMSRYILATDGHRHYAPQANLVMFGDSITEWGPWVDALRDYSLVNRGIAGDTTAGMLRRIDTTLLVKPKLVCVMAGINDLAQGYSVNEVFKNYQQMLNVWREKGVDVLVQSTLYGGERLESLTSQVTELNQKLFDYCQTHQLRFLNVNQVLAPQSKLLDEYSCDDLHLSAYAYLKWLEILKPELKTSNL
ncbi:lysophospholipase [Vibrio sp. T187]|uniref:SGNH/GDSL hydrolase family protein n=1 Tax=Vibrio TaxID=662 RepID=UPI0010C9B801|nr:MULTISPECIES: SGNH/GDSL hydrolase family protein [Vibrio]MBW3698215.1 lysophospholipase [Vibrio sp. T187]